jgi:hypothetical protein
MKVIIISFIISGALAGLHYWMFMSLFFSSMIGIICMGIFWLGIHQWMKSKVISNMEAEMYYFIQSFLTTLAVKKTVHEAYVDVYQRYQMSQQIWLKTYTSNDPLLALDNLKQRFHHPLYQLFYSTLHFYEQQGGEVMALFDSLFRQLRLVESRRLEVQLFQRRYFSQWIILWLLNGLVLIMSKIVLLDLFIAMMESPFFVLMLSSVYIYLPLSFYGWIQAYQSHRGKPS